MRFVIIAVILAFSACKTSAPSKASIKVAKNGGAKESDEEANKKGVCLTSPLTEEVGKETCHESTLRTCLNSSSKTLRAVFDSAPSCKCYELAIQYEKKN